VDNFIPGQAYNIGSGEYHDIKTVSDIILEALGKDDSQVTYEASESFTTRNKKLDMDKAVRDLAHQPKVTLAEGLPITLEWMKQYYGVKRPLKMKIPALVA
jgi:dTDP-glucose 4,6-dehydratase